jgi:topoisomerase-4 subunit A
MSKLLDKLHARTLEQIFIENRIYKRIEEERTTAAISAAVHSGLKPFAKEIGRAVSEEDIEVLLRIPIRRISRYDIERAQKEMREMNARIKEIKHHLAHITDYAIGFLERLIDRYKHIYPRTTQIVSFTATDVREAAQRNLKLRYDKNSGYLGHEVNGNVLFDVSDYDRILIVRKSGAYSVVSTPDKMFVDKGMLFCSLMDKDDAEERVFSIIYKDESGVPYIKRCKIDKFILNKGYTLVPEGCTVLKLTVESSRSFVVEYKPKPRVRVLEEEFKIEDFLVKGVKASGVRLANREVKSVKYSNTSQDEGKES